MTEMLERMARIVCDFKINPCPGSACRVCQDKARAVLEAIRDPTGAVKVAGANALANLEFPPATPQHIVSAEACFQAMIDSILGTAGRASDG